MRGMEAESLPLVATVVLDAVDAVDALEVGLMMPPVVLLAAPLAAPLWMDLEEGRDPSLTAVDHDPIPLLLLLVDPDSNSSQACGT